MKNFAKTFHFIFLLLPFHAGTQSITDSLQLENIFDFPHYYPFKPYWLNEENSSADCVTDNDDLQRSHVSTKHLESISFESLETVMSAEDYAVALYISIHLVSDFPEDIYLNCVIAHCLAELRLRIQNGEYLDYVQFPHPPF